MIGFEHIVVDRGCDVGGRVTLASQVGEQSNHLARHVVLASALPQSVPAVTIDRQCGSSQQALHFAAQAIVPVEVLGAHRTVHVHDRDEGVRREATLEAMSTVKPIRRAEPSPPSTPPKGAARRGARDDRQHRQRGRL